MNDSKIIHIQESLETIAQRLGRIEQRLEAQNGQAKFSKDWYTVAEAAELLGKASFTVREYCRNYRLRAEKRERGRGRTTEWVISAEEIQRYMNEGLLPQKW